MSGDMTETSVTDFFTLQNLFGSINVWTAPCLKDGCVPTHGPCENWRLWPQQLNGKKRWESRKHCALAVVRRSQKLRPAANPGTAKI